MSVAAQQRCVVVGFGETDRPLPAIRAQELLTQIDARRSQTCAPMLRMRPALVDVLEPVRDQHIELIGCASSSVTDERESDEFVASKVGDAEVASSKDRVEEFE